MIRLTAIRKQENTVLLQLEPLEGTIITAKTAGL